MVVLGIDPGLAAVGYGVIRSSGSETFLLEAGMIQGGSEDKPLEERLLAIYRGVSEIIQEWHPGSLALEELYSHYEHPVTAILMGHARGVVCLAAAQHRVAVFNYPSTRVKLMLTGSGRATKEQVGRAVRARLKLKRLPQPDDVADALAVALCHSLIGTPDPAKTKARG